MKCAKELKVISYNMRGFNQGYVAMNELIDTVDPDVFLCQEHWLTPVNLGKFNEYFPNYFTFGCSAMMNRVQSGPLYGRPHGGVITLVKKSLRNITETIHCDERYNVMKISNCLFINVYLPCDGSKDRMLTIETLLTEIFTWRQQYCHLDCYIAGDLNANLNDTDNAIVKCINRFIGSLSLTRADALFPNAGNFTYVNNSLQHYSYIDYMLTSCAASITDFSVCEPDVNFSDHLPIMSTIVYRECLPGDSNSNSNAKCNESTCTKLRWDKADIQSYYSYTGASLYPVLENVDRVTDLFCKGEIDDIVAAVNDVYYSITKVLKTAADLYVPSCRTNFFKFWWDEELSALKSTAIDSNKIWKAAGKPKQGPIFAKRQVSKANYRKAIRDKEKRNTTVYTNELHDSLMGKDGPSFWKCWRSKFETRAKYNEIGGCFDNLSIANNFANYFSQIYTPTSMERAAALREEYAEMRSNYFGFPMSDDYVFTTELVAKIISEIKVGRAPDIDGLMGEHLLKAHPILIVILSRLFHLIVLSRHIPTAFGYSYIVPIPKGTVGINKPLNCDDFRGIAISPIISKIFEYCFLNKLDIFLCSSSNQFGFKKGLGCNHAVYTVRKIVDKLIKGGNTVNMCSVDLSKAFDKVNHHGLLIKLMKRKLPVTFLEIIERWFSLCYSVVKWNCVFSYVFDVQFGVRQGSVLSPFLFALYLDDIWNNGKLTSSSYVVLYADDILLISSSVCELQRTFDACERELIWLDMAINTKKSCCVRIGPRNDYVCANITTSQGYRLPWTNEIRYLGTYIVKSRQFRCSIDHAKKSFCRAANAIFGKVGSTASEEVTLELLRSKCIPVLIYGLECFSLPKSEMKSLDFVVTRFLMKLFKTTNMDVIGDCQSYFGFSLPTEIVERKRDKLIKNYNNVSPLLLL